MAEYHMCRVSVERLFYRKLLQELSATLDIPVESIEFVEGKIVIPDEYIPDGKQAWFELKISEITAALLAAYTPVLSGMSERREWHGDAEKKTC